MRRRVHHHEKTGELNIVPYLDIMVNLTMFMLVSMTSVIQFGILNVAAPSYGPAVAGAAQPQKKELLLTVAISAKGFFVAGSGGVLGVTTDPKAPPPDPKTAAPTVPLAADGKYDYPALTRKMVDIKDKFPGESRVILMADPHIAYEVVIQTMDAIREDGPRKLFFDVTMGAL
jgi:biopolymer transport protein ExbD